MRLFFVGDPGGFCERHGKSYEVATAQRTREIGLRVAMGAQSHHVVGMVLRGAIGLAGAGVLFGLLASLLVSRTLTSLLVDIAPFDLATLAAVSALLLLVAVSAAYVHAGGAPPAWTLSPPSARNSSSVPSVESI